MVIKYLSVICKMLRKVIPLIWLLIVFSPSASSADVTLDLTLTLPKYVEAIRLEDLQFERQNFNKIIFATLFKSDQEIPDVFINFSLTCTKGELFHGESVEFNLPAGACKLTNLDLTLPGSHVNLKTFKRYDAVDWLNQQMEQSGYLPPGKYRLSVELDQKTDSVRTLVSDSVDIVLRNPFGVKLRQPLGDQHQPSIISPDDLEFSWLSNAKHFELTIYDGGYKIVPTPMLNRLPVVFNLGKSTTLKSKKYRLSDLEKKKIQPGKIYYWQVTALVSTSNGIKPFRSGIGAFQMRYSQQDWDRITAYLYQIAGKDSLNLKSELAGYSPNGTIRLDGRQIGIEELAEIVAQIKDNQLKRMLVSTE